MNKYKSITLPHKLHTKASRFHFLAVVFICLTVTSCSPEFWAGFIDGAAMGLSTYGSAYTPTYTAPTYTTPTFTTPYSPSYSTASSSSSTPKAEPIEKEKQTESDGFVWYELTQYQNGKARYGAESSSGKTLVPLGNYLVRYVRDDGYFSYWNDNGSGIYSKDGKCLIPISRGYTQAVFHEETGHTGYFGVTKNGKSGACDLTGREIIAPQYESLIFGSKAFNYKGSDGKWHELPWTLDANGNGVRTTTDSTTTVVSNKSSSRGKLLYKGSYSSNGEVYTGNNVMYVMAGTYDIEIYENVLIDNPVEYELKAVMNDGTRRYVRRTSIADFILLVSPNFNIRRIYPSPYFGQPDGVEYYTKGPVAPPPTPMNQGELNTYQQETDDTPISPSQQQTSRIPCSACGSTGEIKKDYNGIEFTPDFVTHFWSKT